MNTENDFNIMLKGAKSMQTFKDDKEKETYEKVKELCDRVRALAKTIAIKKSNGEIYNIKVNGNNDIHLAYYYDDSEIFCGMSIGWLYDKKKYYMVCSHLDVDINDNTYNSVEEIIEALGRIYFTFSEQSFAESCFVNKSELNGKRH